MAASGNNGTTNRVRRHRATAGLIRVEVEVPNPEDALVVRRFAQARRRAANRVQAAHSALPAAAVTAGEGLEALLASLDEVRRGIVMQFGRALTQVTDPDMLARGHRVARNFADAVAQRARDATLRGDDEAL